MIGLMIVMMTVVVFLSRYLFLEAKISLKKLDNIQGLLRYCAPAVLTAIIAPIIFIQDSGEFNSDLSNPYLVAGVAACVFAYFSKNTLLIVLLSMMLFLLLNL